jgi:hypothetical protein
VLDTRRCSALAARRQCGANALESMHSVGLEL